MNTLEQRLLSARPVLDALCQAMRREAATLFAREPVMISAPTAALYRLQHDPADGTESLVGEWRNAQGHRLGMLVCHASGHCFAEHDILRAHPHDPRWFVEAVEAWGLYEIGSSEDPPLNQTANRAEIQAELRLLQQP
ncbi:MAG: hypothetical protein VBE63_10700 [Lamprobacter sp.]|uniref:hypothetical protein n=1 Tax=Lamprobacter sp. TaxID=3100796 RepID=UPI002B257068|nr:hypothetical protein [Lamprobacter sp.]MEA3640402.1 hypothetical protein [Lamprobacter sp.]